LEKTKIFHDYMTGCKGKPCIPVTYFCISPIPNYRELAEVPDVARKNSILVA
jgi:hypothetical protein